MPIPPLPPPLATAAAAFVVTVTSAGWLLPVVGNGRERGDAVLLHSRHHHRLELVTTFLGRAKGKPTAGLWGGLLSGIACLLGPMGLKVALNLAKREPVGGVQCILYQLLLPQRHDEVLTFPPIIFGEVREEALPDAAGANRRRKPVGTKSANQFYPDMLCGFRRVLLDPSALFPSLWLSLARITNPTSTLYLLTCMRRALVTGFAAAFGSW